LFDALQLLSRLATVGLRSAFQGLRGEPDELFTSMPAENAIDKIRIAVEMLVNPTVKDSLGREEKLRFRRLRYEIEITRGNDQEESEDLKVIFEKLNSIPYGEDTWSLKYASALLESNSSFSGATRENFIDRDWPIGSLSSDGRGQFAVLSPQWTGSTLRGVTN